MAKTTICSTSSCNKVAGSTDGLVVAVAGSAPAGEEATADGENDTAADGDDATPESSALSAVVAALALVFALVL